MRTGLAVSALSLLDIAYDALGRLASVVDENGHEIRFGWDRLGLSRRTTAAGQVTDYVRGETETFAYDRWGRISAHARGSLVVTYAYDHFGRLVERDGNGTVTTYAYDAWGNRTSRTVRDADGVAAVERRSYDGYGRLVEIAALGTSVRYRYDVRGRVARQTVDGTPIDFVYTRCGRLAGKYLGGGETRMPRSSTNIRSPDGQLARADYGGGRAEDFEWDGLALVRRGGERFLNEPHVGGGSPVISSRGVTYLNDALGTTVGAKRGARYSAAALTAFGEGGGRHAFFTGKLLVEGLGRIVPARSSFARPH